MFLEHGFKYDQSIGVLEFDSWWEKVYRKPGWPALFIDQAFTGNRGQNSVIPEWFDAHGDQCFHHITKLVEEIETAMQTLKLKNIEFAGKIIGEPRTNVCQVFTLPEMKDGNAYSVLELIERHNCYMGSTYSDGIYPPLLTHKV